MQLKTVIEKCITDHPHDFINHIIIEDETIWIKRRPLSKKTVWHRLLSLVTYLIPVPIFYPTVVSDSGSGLLEEASRLRLFAKKGIAVPEIVASTSNYLATKNAGFTLQKYLEQANSTEDKLRLLKMAFDALIQLHLAQLCHGRPFLRDMTLHDNNVFLLDLEENPLAVMSLEQAQARDIWLFLNNAARYCLDKNVLTSLFNSNQASISTATLASLKQMVFILKPCRFFIEHALFFIKSKDVRCAIQANKALEQCLSINNRNSPGTSS